jgi:TonB family protein
MTTLSHPASIRSSPALRYSVSTLVGVAMTCAIFLLMYRLIGSGPLKVKTEDLYATVDIYPPEAPPPPKPQTKQPEPESQRKTVLEPEMSPLALGVSTASTTLDLPAAPVMDAPPAMDDIALNSGSGNILGNGTGTGDLPKTWTPPGDDKLAKKIAEADAKGANGYREVLPNSTRQPNIPEYAWKNKIDGWVLVTFTVNTKGEVENVRVLDAQPRGVFEDNVIASVSHWIYDPADFHGRKVKAQLTQRIELFYKDYPRNNRQIQ